MFNICSSLYSTNKWENSCWKCFGNPNCFCGWLNINRFKFWLLKRASASIKIVVESSARFYYLRLRYASRCEEELRSGRFRYSIRRITEIRNDHPISSRLEQGRLAEGHDWIRRSPRREGQTFEKDLGTGVSGRSRSDQPAVTLSERGILLLLMLNLILDFIYCCFCLRSQRISNGNFLTKLLWFFVEILRNRALFCWYFVIKISFLENSFFPWFRINLFIF